jgi:hypothetical protein
MIAYCGLDCTVCKSFVATQTKDAERKKQIAEQWSQELKVKFKPEDVNCEGCKSEVISGWCRKICKIRPCAQTKKVETCAHCEEYICSRLTEFLPNEPEAKANLEKIRELL